MDEPEVSVEKASWGGPAITMENPVSEKSTTLQDSEGPEVTMVDSQEEANETEGKDSSNMENDISSVNNDGPEGDAHDIAEIMSSIPDENTGKESTDVKEQIELNKDSIQTEDLSHKCEDSSKDLEVLNEETKPIEDSSVTVTDKKEDVSVTTSTDTETAVGKDDIVDTENINEDIICTDDTETICTKPATEADKDGFTDGENMNEDTTPSDDQKPDTDAEKDNISDIENVNKDVILIEDTKDDDTENITKDVAHTPTDAVKPELVSEVDKEDIPGTEKADDSLSDVKDTCAKSATEMDKDVNTEAEDLNKDVSVSDDVKNVSTDSEKVDKNVMKNKESVGTSDLKKNNLEDVSDEEMPVNNDVESDDVLILKEEPGQKILGDIDLTVDDTSPSQEKGETVKKKAKTKITVSNVIKKSQEKSLEKSPEKSLEKSPEKSEEKSDNNVLLVDGQLEVTMEVEDVIELEQEEKVLKARPYTTVCQNHSIKNLAPQKISSLVPPPRAPVPSREETSQRRDYYRSRRGSVKLLKFILTNF